MLRIVLPAMVGFWLIVIASCAAKAEVIRKDTGGPVIERIFQVAAYQQSGEAVKIKGLCASSCTMLLRVDNVCVTRWASLGFHGPYHKGRDITDKEAQAWAKTMANHYPPVVSKWFMQKGRFIGPNEVATIKGAWLIDNAGVRECGKEKAR